MTKPQAVRALVVGATAAVVLLLVHLLVLPVPASWTVNRVLHHVWEGLVLAGAAGAVVLFFRIKTGTRRRDLQRAEARRRLVAVVVVVVAAVGMAVTAELLRDASSRRRLRAAEADLEAVARAVEAYRADHGGTWPEDVGALAPTYLPRAHLYYRYRHGPRGEGPPPEDAGDAAPPTYRLVPPREKKPGEKAKPESPVAAYLRPGCAWGPLTAVLGRSGVILVRGDDLVVGLETAAAERPADVPADAPPEAAPAPEPDGAPKEAEVPAAE